MKDAEDEAFDDIARRQGAWGGGFKAKRAMAAGKLQEPYDQTALELCNVCGWKTLIPDDGCLNCERKEKPAQQEALYGMNQDDWKDVVAAITKVRDGRGIYLGCRPADVFQDWFLALGTAKVKEKNT